MKALLLFTITFLTSCAPIPHFARIQPELKGTILFYGKPAVGAVVKQCIVFEKRECSKYKTVKTNNKGWFRLAPVREFRWFIPLFGDAFYIYEFEVEYRGKLYPGCTGGDTGVLSNISEFEYELTSKKDCDLNLVFE